MPKVKIISNPYDTREGIKYQQMDESGEWINIDVSTHKNSMLISEKMARSFFPFKVKEIVDRIVKEYQIDGESIEIHFEGSKDEFEELAAVCNEGNYDVKVVPVRSNRYLENARDILPEVIGLFEKLKPLIADFANEEQINHFTDATNDIVPICVLGNYSSGKSTFINALVGYEILPSGANPVTNRIYKICRSTDNTASVRFKCSGDRVTIHFTDSSSFFEDGYPSNELTGELKREMDSLSGKPFALKVNKIISIINEPCYDVEIGTSDFIEIEIPFRGDILAKSSHRYVLFDTPGPNSETNPHHIDVLKKITAGMTNGLPVFVTTHSTFDVIDNNNLYEIIRKSEGLDARFTMIIANIADQSPLKSVEPTAEEKQIILKQSIPCNLYSGGIFYVSSILGLGAKNGADFLSDFYTEKFEGEKEKYIDSKSKWHKALYMNNIMPPQIKARTINISKEHFNSLYANSGLLSIENEIETFASKYSAYNKCFQARHFLDEIISTSEKRIASERKTKEDKKEQIKREFDQKKKELLNKIKITSSKKRNDFDSDYRVYIMSCSALNDTFTGRALKEKEKEITAELEEKYGYNLPRKPQQSKREYNSARKTLSEQISKEASEKLIEHVKSTYTSQSEDFSKAIYESSKKYWEKHTEDLRIFLDKIVSISDALSEERREELKKIIFERNSISFNEKEAIKKFNSDRFKKAISIGGITLIDFKDLNFSKIAKTYKKEITSQNKNWAHNIQEEHEIIAHLWIDSLTSDIMDNIENYNPDLIRKNKDINKKTSQIKAIVSRQKKIEKYKDELCALMDWKLA